MQHIVIHGCVILLGCESSSSQTLTGIGRWRREVQSFNNLNVLKFSCTMCAP